jgi:hypothetical protein
LNVGVQRVNFAFNAYVSLCAPLKKKFEEMKSTNKKYDTEKKCFIVGKFYKVPFYSPLEVNKLKQSEL